MQGGDPGAEVRAGGVAEGLFLPRGSLPAPALAPTSGYASTHLTAPGRPQP